MMDEAGPELDSISVEVGGRNSTADSVPAFEDDVSDAIFGEDGGCSNT